MQRYFVGAAVVVVWAALAGAAVIYAAVSNTHTCGARGLYWDGAEIVCSTR